MVQRVNTARPRFRTERSRSSTAATDRPPITRLRGTLMKTVNICAATLLLVVVVAGAARPFAAMSADPDFSGIVSYVFEPNPQEIKPKMYNWEVTLSKSDSQSGAYEIVQITRPTRQIMMESSISTYTSGTRRRRRTWAGAAKSACPSSFPDGEPGGASRVGSFSRARRSSRLFQPPRERAYQMAGWA